MCDATFTHYKLTEASFYEIEDLAKALDSLEWFAILGGTTKEAVGIEAQAPLLRQLKGAAEKVLEQARPTFQVAR